MIKNRTADPKRSAVYCVKEYFPVSAGISARRAVLNQVRHYGIYTFTSAY